MKKTAILFTLLVMADLAAASAFENQELLDSKVDSINAHRGVEIGGSIRAVAQASHFSTDMDKYAVDQMPDVERDEMAVADLDFHFRPFENVRANVMFRFGAGMQEYFSSPSKTMSVGWANVEGNIGNSFYWVVGDFRQQYSPLTLFLPSVDIMYEPLVFERQRHMAQKSQFIEGNQRNLQGVNLQFRTMPNNTVGEIRAEALMARLNRAAVLDFSGAEGNIITNAEIPGASQASNMDKWLAAGNIELLPLNRNAYAGFTGMFIFDDEESFSYTERHPDQNLQEPYVREPINPFDMDAQQTMVISGRIGGDLAGFLGNNKLVLDAVAEIAMSNDKVYAHTPTYLTDEAGNALLDATDVEEPATQYSSISEMLADADSQVEGLNAADMAQVSNLSINQSLIMRKGRRKCCFLSLDIVRSGIVRSVVIFYTCVNCSLEICTFLTCYICIGSICDCGFCCCLSCEVGRFRCCWSISSAINIRGR